MKLVAALGLLGGMFIVGCAGGAPKANSPSDAMLASQVEHELAHAIGTTSLTSASLTKDRLMGVDEVFPGGAKDKPMGLDEAYPAESAPVQTWSPAAADESDLAKNPYDRQ